MPFEDRGKWGYVSQDGIVIPAHFDYAGLFKGDGRRSRGSDLAHCGNGGGDNPAENTEEPFGRANW